MKYLSTLIANQMLKKGATFEDKELFEFGLRTFLRSAMVYTLAFICSLILDFTIIYLVFSIPFLILRQCTGGYHAKSLQACFVESLILLIGIPLLILNFSNLFSSILIINFIATICSITLLFSCIKLNMKKVQMLFYLLIICTLSIYFCSFQFIELSLSLTIAIFTNLVLFLLGFMHGDL